MKHFNFKNSNHLESAICKDILGHGGFSVVKLFQCKRCHKQDKCYECNECFVIKEFTNDLGPCYNKLEMITKSQLLYNMLLNEYNIGSKLNHENIIKTIDIDKVSMSLMLEHITGTDFLDYLNINSCKNGKYIITSFYYMLHALEYMHDIGIAHRDIKLENILLGEDGKNVKLIDFGQSIEYKKNNKYKYTHDTCGTEGYFPPEYYRDSKYMPDKVDVWCCGMVLYNIVFDCVPWDYAHSDDEQYVKCHTYFEKNELEPRIFSSRNYIMNVSNEDINIIDDIFKSVFNLIPSDRITVKELKEKIAKLSLCII